MGLDPARGVVLQTNSRNWTPTWFEVLDTNLAEEANFNLAQGDELRPSLGRRTPTWLKEANCDAAQGIDGMKF